MSTSIRTLYGGAALALAATLAVPAAAPAQEAMDGPWLALTGCWVEVGAAESAPMTCVVPGTDEATFLTVRGGAIVDRNVVRADGVERPMEQGGCEGVQATDISRTGTRLFTRARLTCEGGTTRSTRGLVAMVAPDAWIQVRALTVGAGSVSWVTRYQSAPASRVEAAAMPELNAAIEGRRTAIETARMVAAGPLTVDDVIEAHGRTEPEAVRSWIVEQRRPLELDAERLVRMADAGVGAEVIDVALAVTYPDRFEVARQPEPRGDDMRRSGRYGYAGYGDDLWWSRGYYDPFYLGYSPYSYRYNRYRYRYGYGPGYGPGYGSPTVIVVRPSGSGDRSGRVVKGQGYVPRGSSQGSDRARPARGSSSGGIQARPSGTTRVSPPSSSGSSSSKGKAKRRGGGGG